MSEPTTPAPARDQWTRSQILRGVIPSLVGAFCFMCPISNGEGGLTIPLTFIINWVNTYCATWLIYATLLVVISSAAITLLTAFFKPKFILNNAILKNTFDVSWIWVVARVIGAVLIIMTYWQIGPEFLIGPDTGTFILYDLLGSIFTIAIIAGGLLPLLTEFGLMEFVGTLVGPICKKVFCIPGRAAVDCITSWLGDTSVAVVLTNGQMEKGYYTQREAAVIASTFSAVSITFALVIIDYVGFAEDFFVFYGIVAIVGIICAIIMPRIPPLSRIPDTYIVESTYDGEIYHAPGYNLVQWSWRQAMQKANNNGYTAKSYLVDWLRTSITIQFVLPPIIMAVGTCMLAVAYNTPVLEWLGYPFLPLLKLLQIPEAAAASQTMVAGFADMFIPAVLAAGTITSGYTRFLVAIISITQLIFISENGSMILSTKIPLNFVQLFVIFLERTVISLVAASLILRVLMPGLL